VQDVEEIVIGSNVVRRYARERRPSVAIRIGAMLVPGSAMVRNRRRRAIMADT
jgi:hypothetical protein